MRDALAGVGVVLILISLATTLVAIIALPAMWFESMSCERRWAGTFETSYGPIQGCRIKVDGRFIPEANWRGIDQP